jgi:hypothetical protein
MIALQHKVPDTYEQMYLFMTNGIFTNNWTNSVAWRQACYNKVLAFAASQNKDNKVKHIYLFRIYSQFKNHC